MQVGFLCILPEQRQKPTRPLRETQGHFMPRNESPDNSGAEKFFETMRVFTGKQTLRVSRQLSCRQHCSFRAQSARNQQRSRFLRNQDAREKHPSDSVTTGLKRRGSREIIISPLSRDHSQLHACADLSPDRADSPRSRQNQGGYD